MTAPEATSVELYGQVALRCLGPAGAPAAHLSWLKNGSPLVPEASTTVIVSGEGHLLVSQATLQVGLPFSSFRVYIVVFSFY